MWDEDSPNRVPERDPTRSSLTPTAVSVGDTTPVVVPGLPLRLAPQLSKETPKDKSVYGQRTPKQIEFR